MMSRSDPATFGSAIVDIGKLRDYCLSNTHPDGRHKARVFSAKLGMTSTDAGALKAAIEEGILPAEVSVHGQTQYGSLSSTVMWQAKSPSSEQHG